MRAGIRGMLIEGSSGSLRGTVLGSEGTERTPVRFANEGSFLAAMAEEDDTWFVGELEGGVLTVEILEKIPVVEAADAAEEVSTEAR